MGWLEWTGWGGISGLVSLLALAAALAVTYIEVRAWWLSPRNVDVAAVISLVEQQPAADQLKFSFRVVGPRTLHEVKVRRVGGNSGPEQLGETIAVFETRDGTFERTTWWAAGAPPVYFIVTWYDQNRSGPRIRALRFAWGVRDAKIEEWKTFRWPFFRKHSGRWIPEESRTIRGMKGIFIPSDETPSEFHRPHQETTPADPT